MLMRKREQVEADIRHCQEMGKKHGIFSLHAWATREKELRAELASIKQKENEG